MKCELCGKDVRYLESYLGLKTKFKFACKDCIAKAKGRKK